MQKALRINSALRPRRKSLAVKEIRHKAASEKAQSKQNIITHLHDLSPQKRDA